MSRYDDPEVRRLASSWEFPGGVKAALRHIKRQQAIERNAQTPAETPVEAGDEWVQDFIHRLGRDYEERAQRVRDGRES